MDMRSEIENAETKEINKNITYAIYKLTRQIAVVLTLVVSIYWLLNGGYLKAVLNLINGFCFIYISREYQRKVDRITVSYAFVFLIVFLVYGICSCYFTLENISALHPVEFTAWGEKDYYYLYFIVNILVYALIGLYLKLWKKEFSSNFSEIKISRAENVNFLVGSSVLTVLSLVTGNGDLIVPVIALILGRIIVERKNRILLCCIFVLFAVVFKSTMMQRFYFIQMVLPCVFIYLVCSKYNHKKISMAKIYAFLVLGVALIGVYGTVSEIIKLNSIPGQRSYSLKAVLTSFESLFYFFERQAYRLFYIWIKLGGYILYHVDNVSSFYWGLTYIKPLAGVFGFEYVSLPVIAAMYNQSAYAQPGLLAEGYANFGIFGSVCNILIVFFFMEYTRYQFYKKPSFSNLLLMTVPFTKILLDGGTLNSAIFLYVMLLLCTFWGNTITKKRSKN